jgi:hypothetical protein
VYVEAAGAQTTGDFVLHADRVIAVGGACADTTENAVCAGDVPCVDGVCGDLEDRMCAVEVDSRALDLSHITVGDALLPVSSSCAPSRTDLIGGAVRYHTGAVASELTFGGSDGAVVFVERRDTCALAETATCDAAAFSEIPPDTDLTLVFAMPADAPATFVSVTETPTP